LSTKLTVMEEYSDRHLDSYWIVFDEPVITRPRLAVLPVADAIGKLLPDHAERRRLVYQLAAAPQLIEALEATNELALELMGRAARIDRKLLVATKSPDEGVELGEIVRLRQQVSRNRSILEALKQKAQER
jgi:hypothetical protein